MFPLFPEHRKSIPYILCGKQTFQKRNPPFFNFYLGKLNNKHFPIWCNVNFESVFSAINNTKSKENLTLHHMRKVFIS